MLRESTPASALVNAYTYAGADLVGVRSAAQGSTFILADGQNSTRALTNLTGNVVASFTYDAFGGLLSSTGASGVTALFNGQQIDPATGLYNSRKLAATWSMNDQSS